MLRFIENSLFKIVTTPAILFLTGLVFSDLWSWFIVPTFELEPIGIIYSIGVVLIVRFVTHPFPRKDVEKAARAFFEKPKVDDNISEEEKTIENTNNTNVKVLVFIGKVMRIGIPWGVGYIIYLITIN